MKFTFSWLNEHIKLDRSAEQISKELTNLGLEVESLNELNSNYKKFLFVKLLKPANILMLIV